MRRRRLSWRARALRHLVLLAGAAIMLGPFVWMISTSLKPPTEIFSTSLTLLPHQWYAIENYRDAFTRVPLLRYLFNGIFVTFAIVAAMFVTASCAGYIGQKPPTPPNSTSYTVTVTAAAAGGPTHTQTFTLTVTQ